MILITFLINFLMFLNIRADDTELRCEQITVENFNQAINSKAYAFIFFYDPKCSHSIKYMPFWNDVVSRYENSEKVKIACFNCKQNIRFCYSQKAIGFPTLNWYAKGELIDDYTNSRDTQQLNHFIDCWSDPENRMNEWLDRQVQIDIEIYEKSFKEAEQKKASEIIHTDGLNCEELSINNLDEAINSKQFAFIFFYDPKCSHSIKYMPFWNDVVTKYQRSEKVKIACFNCKKKWSFCREQGAWGFPTINWYAGGKFVDEYPNDRNSEQLNHFIDCWSDPVNRMGEWRKKQQEIDYEEEEKEKRKAAKKAAKLAAAAK